MKRLFDDHAPLSADETPLIFLRPQQTIARATRVAGFGYWSGRDVTLEFRPAPPHTGVVFVRGDLQPPVRIPARTRHRIEVPRRTTLSVGGVCVEMVEHVLAALAGLRVDNCEVWTSAPEMPGCDGSSLAFSQALLDAGIVEQGELRSRLVVTEITRVGNEDCWVEARPSKGNVMELKYRLDYSDCPAIGRQKFQLSVTPASFQAELASARTFVLKQEADWLRAQGLGARVTYSDLLIFDENGPIENTLRCEDECVRHKTLDLLGDLALAGCDLIGRFTAHRSGHRLNAELVNVLLTEGQIVESVRRTA